MALTESFAVIPTAAVTGLYFAHTDSRYFGVGKFQRDQVADYAERKGWRPDEAERWLDKPVIAINAAVWWMALRDNGIEDKVFGCGRLLRDY